MSEIIFTNVFLTDPNEKTVAIGRYGLVSGQHDTNFGMFRGRFSDHRHSDRRSLPAIRETLVEVKPGSVLIDEHCHDASGFLGVPLGVPRRPGPAVVATMRDFASSVAWKVAARQWNLLGSHDTPRIATVTQSPAAQRLAAALLFTYPGTPMMFAGDEIGLCGTNGEHSRTPFPWQHADRWDADTLQAYRALLHLRREPRALRRGGLRW